VIGHAHQAVLELPDGAVEIALFEHLDAALVIEIGGLQLGLLQA